MDAGNARSARPRSDSLKGDPLKVDQTRGGLVSPLGRASPVKLRESYDWIVVGDHPAAVLTGALVAKLGLSVLQLSYRDAPARKISRRGQWLEWESNWLPGFGVGGLGWHLLSYLGARPSELSFFESASLSVGVASPEYRVLLESSRMTAGLKELESLDGRFGSPGPLRGEGWSERLANLQGWVPEVWIQSILSTLWEPAMNPGPGLASGKGKRTSTLPLGGVPLPSGWKSPVAMQERLGPWWFGKEKRSVEALDQALSKNPGQLEVVRAWSSDLWGCAPDQLPAGAFPHALSFFGQTASFKGGKSAFNSLLARVAARAGVQVVTPIECRKIFSSSSSVTGVQTNTKGGLIRARGIALGCGTEQALELLAETGESRSLLQRQTLLPAGWKFTLALTVRDVAFAPPLARRMLWSEEGAPVVEVEWAPVEDFPLPERGRYLVFLRTLLPWDPEALQEERLRIESARLLKVFERLVPGVSRHFVRMFPDFRSKSGDYREAYPYQTLNEIPEALRVYRALGSPMIRQGASQFLGIEGLFLANGEACGELGRVGVFARAIESAAWMAHRSGLGGPFTSRQLVRSWGPVGRSE